MGEDNDNDDKKEESEDEKPDKKSKKDDSEDESEDEKPKKKKKRNDSDSDDYKPSLKKNDHHELKDLRESLSIKMNLMSRKMKNQQRKQSQSLFKRSAVQEVNLTVILMAQDKHLVERRRRRQLLLILTLILTSTWQIVIDHQSRVNPIDPIKAVDDHHQTSARNHLAKRGRLHLALALTIQILMMTEEREEVAEEN